MSIDAHQIFNEYIKASGLKGTTQREIILDAFLSTNDHVSVDDLHMILKKLSRKVGYATIYRTMKLIADSGLAREVLFNDGISRFEHTIDSEHHHHLICQKCKKIVEFSSEALDAEEKAIARKHEFETHSHHFKIFGICKDCRKMAERKQNQKKRVNK
ncbi:MAG: transcriptional repressor [candidate division Zixibacteria bacterium]